MNGISYPPDIKGDDQQCHTQVIGVLEQDNVPLLSPAFASASPEHLRAFYAALQEIYEVSNDATLKKVIEQIANKKHVDRVYKAKRLYKVYERCNCTGIPREFRGKKKE